MKSSAWLGAACALALGGAVQLQAAKAAAQECDSDSDCAAGLTCKKETVQDDCARPAIDCAEGEECPEPAPCESREYSACVLPACESDDDCPSGTVCHAQTYERCSDPGAAPALPPCAEGEDCPEPADRVCDEACKAAMAENCEEVTEPAACVPVWTLPCTESADCGAGFTCEERINEWCRGSSGGAPTPGDGGGSDGDPGDAADPLPPEQTEPECGSEPTGEFYCKATITECASDDDCTAGWSCEDNPSRPVCGGAGERPASDGDSAGSGDSGGSGDFAPPPEEERLVAPCDESTEPAKVCMPPYYDQDGGGVTRGEGHAASDNDSGGAEPPTAGTPDRTDGDDENGETGGDGEESGSMGEPESSSCTVAAPGAGRDGGGLGLLVLLGLSALLRRRTRIG